VISSRNLEDLLDHVATRARGLIAEAESRFDIELRVTSTYRDFEEQRRLFTLGRTVPGANVSEIRRMGDTVTKAKPGLSWHNWRRAFDVVPVRAGICLWDDASLWDDIGALATKYGLEWGGSWRGFQDRPHFQVTDGLRIVNLLAMHPEGLK